MTTMIKAKHGTVAACSAGVGSRSYTIMLGAMLAMMAIFIVGCASPAPAPAQSGPIADEALPVEQQQIKNVVEDYFARESGRIPEYTSTIEQVQDNWARVSIHPVGVENQGGSDIIYLQNQVEATSNLPTPTVVLSPTQSVRISTDTGWTIVAGPQATFTSAELDAASVPEFIRP